MLEFLKLRAKLILAYLGDAAHRRFVATVIALAVTHFVGKALDADSVAQTLEVIIGGLGGAWSSTTPPLEPGDAGKAGE